MGQVNITDLTKIYNDGSNNEIIAVDDLDVTIQDGEFLVLVGPSGCGKSTTLRCLAGLEMPTYGRIEINGEEVTQKRPKERGVAMVFQNYALYPHMNVQKNMSFGLKMTTDLSKEERREKVEWAADILDISDLLEKHPKDLSGGQQQRVALGRAIVRDPELFLMDEPLSNLDAKLRTTMRTELQQLQQDLEVTTVYVTHDQTEAMTMGDQIAVLNRGKLQQIGTPLECYHQPENKFVAGFIGSPSMNFINVSHRDGQLEAPSFTYDITPEIEEEIDSDNRELTLGIRPQDIELANSSVKNAVPATVNVVEPMGEVSYLYLEIGDQTFTASVSGELIIDNQQELHVMFPIDRIHLFDQRTGEAVKNREAIDEGEALEKHMIVPSNE
ncbi:trehalose/maltose import ATP-binding protein MalK [Halalkalicoccus paucihalophilus]|uniref:ABC-type D-xylose/L-arabinose transporter n=1 Tax=Halalkalicoccus paucihalophilus TaxID=1008153 RepID=A0A151AA00_9EURY|nr:ABC transporter ATP-binding protein [Halalkalicoccus paucihalophilus]KYH24424.1 trehalose/maltose import ATP-binding protein MalK [Halalkalicoccus paucihalophilus]